MTCKPRSTPGISQPGQADQIHICYDLQTDKGCDGDEDDNDGDDDDDGFHDIDDGG